MSTNNNNTNGNNGRRDDEIGAIWGKDGANGKYYFGKIKIDGQEIPFVMFKNTFKEANSNQPDWRIYRSRATTTAPTQPVAPKPEPVAAPVAAAAPTTTSRPPVRRPAVAPRPTATAPVVTPAPTEPTGTGEGDQTL